ncbi:family 20 glycosylhydrolase [Chitinophaga sp. Ak27]|uniref:family 20 glycosylhydrolase n=1 Tax=Chitinophaga sp. Ak27 TaxID=2726116 RepID=UPI00145F074E|nr:family 20 glycosylhydrolase [Chitinophaga sp. Ak27]NLU95506.1 family 20 glycosylhydrolase [Chitinophaga sp. Ak27]
MKTLCLSVLLLGLALATSAQQPAGNWEPPHTLEELQAAPVALIPFPQQVTWQADRWHPNTPQVLLYEEVDKAQIKNAITALQAVLSAAGIKTTVRGIPVGAKVPRQAVWLKIDTALPLKAEGYQLDVSAAGVRITGKDAAGAFYAIQTLKELLPLAGKRISVLGCHITDAPAFSLRGFMHDTGRNFRDIASLKKTLDLLAAYKFNTFHWHLTDNPAWRPESKVFPQLNDPKNRKPGRDPGKGYSFDEIRDLVAYARERCITIIPELDMPGHSAYFEPTFGFKMGTPQGMEVLEKLIDEFCAEIPASDCPIIHLGSDEVHIPDPKLFMQRMAGRVKSHGRRVMVWNPGLQGPSGTIEQLWYDMDPSELHASANHPYVDSYAGYLNSGNALNLIQRYFFQQVCNRPQGDSLALGGILCCWPDTRVVDKEKIPLHNPVWPGALTYSEAIWCGRPGYNGSYMQVMPGKNTLAWQHFHEFEKRLAFHRDHYFTDTPFPFAAFSEVTLSLSGPFARTAGEPADASFAPEAGSMGTVYPLTGGVQMLPEVIKYYHLPDSTLETLYLSTEIYSETARQIYAWIGFETAARSTRLSAGIPAAGQWDANGGSVWVNGKPLPAPQWQQPGANRYLTHTWERPGNEIPFTDEEFFWSRPPAAIALQKGWNRILIRVPRSYAEQNWQCAFVPVKVGPNGRWVEDLSLRFR